VKGEAGTRALGDRDDRIECSMCWTVKRDVFDIPVSFPYFQPRNEARIELTFRRCLL
jgi:hypothetical protein